MFSLVFLVILMQFFGSGAMESIDRNTKKLLKKNEYIASEWGINYERVYELMLLFQADMKTENPCNVLEQSEDVIKEHFECLLRKPTSKFMHFQKQYGLEFAYYIENKMFEGSLPLLPQSKENTLYKPKGTNWNSSFGNFTFHFKKVLLQNLPKNKFVRLTCTGEGEGMIYVWVESQNLTKVNQYPQTLTVEIKYDEENNQIVINMMAAEGSQNKKTITLNQERFQLRFDTPYPLAVKFEQVSK